MFICLCAKQSKCRPCVRGACVVRAWCVRGREFVVGWLVGAWLGGSKMCGWNVGSFLGCEVSVSGWVGGGIPSHSLSLSLSSRLPDHIIHSD